LRFIKNYL